RRQGADRQAAAEVGLPPSDGLPRGADADRDRVDRRGNEAGSSENGNEACRADVAGDYGKGNGAPAAKGVRRIHRRRDRREGQAVEARAARGGARVRAGSREQEGRDRGARSCDRDEAGEELDGTQERTRLVAQRTRLESEDARREDLLRPGGKGRDDPRPPAWDEVPPAPGDRPRA